MRDDALHHLPKVTNAVVVISTYVIQNSITPMITHEGMTRIWRRRVTISKSYSQHFNIYDELNNLRSKHPISAEASFISASNDGSVCAHDCFGLSRLW